LSDHDDFCNITLVTPTARSAILDLLSTVRSGSVSVSALVRAGGLLGIEANAVRVGLARLRAQGLVASDSRGRYRLGSGASVISNQVGSWRRIEERVRPWSGTWLAVHTGPLRRTDRRQVRRRERALAFLGFRALDPGLELRPDNLAEPLEATRSRLVALGLDPAALVCQLAGLDETRTTAALRLWDTAALRRGYRETRERLAASMRALATAPREQAMVESFRVGGEGIRQLAYDPLLPEEILPVSERRELVDRMREYDRMGRGFWEGALEIEVDETATPADVRGLDAMGALALAEGA
jgi:phenylacetic acid degradation operon negative regulatory protein